MPRLPIIITVATLLVCFNIVAQSQPTNEISLAGELSQLYNISLLPQYRTNSVVAQTSTYDVTGGNNDGFEGTYSFVRRNADSSLVMFDVTGAGVINRIATPHPYG